MTAKERKEKVYQMFELNPSVDKKGSLKVLVKAGLAEQSGYKTTCQDGNHRFYGWWDDEEKLLKIKAVDIRNISKFIQKSK